MIIESINDCLLVVSWHFLDGVREGESGGKSCDEWKIAVSNGNQLSVI